MLIVILTICRERNKWKEENNESLYHREIHLNKNTLTLKCNFIMFEITSFLCYLQQFISQVFIDKVVIALNCALPLL